MPPRLPTSVKLTRRALDRADALFAHFVRVLRPSAADAGFAVQSFAFKNDEHAFARALLQRRTEIWLFRSNQRAYCGDFIAVDMSNPSPDRRRAIVIDLKRGAPLRTGGGAGVQLRNAAEAVAQRMYGPTT